MPSAERVLRADDFLPEKSWQVLAATGYIGNDPYSGLPDAERLVFSPLLERFVSGEDYRARAVKVSDSGRIRNELQTLCSQALEYDGDTIRVHFDRINDDVIRPEERRVIRDVLGWYRENHPVWFSSLELA